MSDTDTKLVHAYLQSLAAARDEISRLAELDLADVCDRMRAVGLDPARYTLRDYARHLVAQRATVEALEASS